VEKTRMVHTVMMSVEKEAQPAELLATAAFAGLRRIAFAAAGKVQNAQRFAKGQYLY